MNDRVCPFPRESTNARLGRDKERERGGYGVGMECVWSGEVGGWVGTYILYSSSSEGELGDVRLSASCSLPLYILPDVCCMMPL